ncbi:hypothetical protein BGZ90_001719 [Linnemannia elongata]|nr:hypothetical protein BGZ90_001719 [Linnemannia elongata]
MSSSNIITANDFALLLGGLESFYNALPVTTSHATTIVASPESTHTQLPTTLQSHDQQQQLQQHQQQQTSPQLQLLVIDSSRPEVRPSRTLPATPATTATESCPPDQETSLSTHTHVTLIQSLDHDLSRPDLAHGTVDQSIQSASTTTPGTPTKATTKIIQSSPLCTNAAEFIANYIWHIPAPAPTHLRNKDSPSVSTMHLPKPSVTAPHSIRQRSVASHITRDSHVGHKQSHWSSTVPKEDEAMNKYTRHHRRIGSDPYISADLLPDADDRRSTPLALEKLLDEPHETVLTEEQKRAMIENGRAIGNSATWPPHHRHSNNKNNSNSSNNSYSQRQRDSHTNIDMSLQGIGRRDYRSKITYSRDFLMSFRAFNVPPGSIDRIHWIQQNPTLDHPQEAAGMRMARPQPVFQEPRGDYQRAGIYGPEMGHRQSGRGDGAFRGDVTSNEEDKCRRGSGFSASNFLPPPPLPSATRAPRHHFQRSSASATGGLSGSVFRFKARMPLGPPAAPQSGFQIRGFESRTAR